MLEKSCCSRSAEVIVTKGWKHSELETKCLTGKASVPAFLWTTIRWMLIINLWLSFYNRPQCQRKREGGSSVNLPIYEGGVAGNMNTKQGQANSWDHPHFGCLWAFRHRSIYLCILFCLIILKGRINYKFKSNQQLKNLCILKICATLHTLLVRRNNYRHVNYTTKTWIQNQFNKKKWNHL